MKKLFAVIISVMIIGILCGCTKQTPEERYYWYIEDNKIIEISPEEYDPCIHRTGNKLDMQYDAIRLYLGE